MLGLDRATVSPVEVLAIRRLGRKLKGERRGTRSIHHQRDYRARAFTEITRAHRAFSVDGSLILSPSPPLFLFLVLSRFLVESR